MSTKIYTAYKLKRDSDLWAVCASAHATALKIVTNTLRDLYLCYALDIKADDPELVEQTARYDGREDVARLELAHRYVSKRYATADEGMRRDPFDLNVSIGIWRHGKSWYLRPFCDMLVNTALNCLERDQRIVPYGYWNNTDRPEGVSASEWRVRQRVWDGIARQYQELCNPHLSIEVMSYQRFKSLLGDPYFEMNRELRTKTLADMKAEGPRSRYGRIVAGLPELEDPEPETAPGQTSQPDKPASPAKVVTKRTKSVKAAKNAAGGKPVKPARPKREAPRKSKADKNAGKGRDRDDS